MRFTYNFTGRNLAMDFNGSDNLALNITGNDKFAMDIYGNSTANLQPFRCFFISAEYESFYRKYWSVYFLIVYNAIPAAIIITGNINIAVFILKERFGLTARVRSEINPTVANRKRSSAKLLFTLSTFYLLTTTPWCVYWILRGKISFQAKLSPKSLAGWQLATVIVQVCLWCNFSFNFFFYFVSGTLFKREWTKLVDKVKENFRRS
jgi:hypothetical protein